MNPIEISLVQGVASLGSTEWDALDHGRSPFTEHTWLRALEDSGSVGPGTGWTAVPLLARRGGDLIGAVPLYLKSHSFGEYVFDQGWARAAHSIGQRYYPKLVVAVPFTPATGRRILLRDPADRDAAHVLVRATLALTSRLGASSVHWLFADEWSSDHLREFGLAERHDLQYHLWNGPDPDALGPERCWATFDDMLASWKGPRRRELRRERRLVADAGLCVAMEPGASLSAADWATIDTLYRQNAREKGGEPYLHESFFEMLRTRWADRIVVACARREGALRAFALCVRRGDALYGRHWGSAEAVPALHFELCYHLPWEWALEQGIRLYEAGAQGEHKIQRGFLPRTCRSFHHILDARLDHAVRQSLADERPWMEERRRALQEHGPFRPESGRL